MLKNIPSWIWLELLHFIRQALLQWGPELLRWILA
jgi:hypothetical protein